MRNALAVLAASVLFLSGCGGASPAGPAPTPNLLTGNWGLMSTSGPSLQIGAYLVNASGALTGTMHVTNNPTCYPFTAPGMPADISFTGTYNSNSGAVSITSSAVLGQVITINGTVASGTTALTGGTYSITGAGGCANGETGTITGSEQASLTYTYAGSLSSPTATVSLPLQEQGPDQHGLYTLGVLTPQYITYTGSTCFTMGVPNSSTYVTGNYVYITINNNDTSMLTFTGATTDNTGKTITGTYQISGGSCDGDSGSLTITHP